MATVAHPHALATLMARLERLEPGAPRRWGTMTAGEMLCHLGDANTGVLDPREGRRKRRPRPIVKWLALVSPLPWPHGLVTPKVVDPKAGGTRPGMFDSDRTRAIDSLRSIATATAMSPAHSILGPMTVRDWQRWAWKHTDHHLRQFGL
jgi:DinB family protein